MLAAAGEAVFRRHGHADALAAQPRIAGPIGPAEVDAQAMQTIEHIDLQKNEVPFFLRYRGMEAAIKKIRELEA
ncbi:hypothetical protein [Bradyrhizobium elkanii]|uniref:hypothetical protein n=1 Tax=Bradyrhizobium elkanii TaxID=29448 RepID=UPI003516B239